MRSKKKKTKRKKISAVTQKRMVFRAKLSKRSETYECDKRTHEQEQNPNDSQYLNIQKNESKMQR